MQKGLRIKALLLVLPSSEPLGLEFIVQVRELLLLPIIQVVSPTYQQPALPRVRFPELVPFLAVNQKPTASVLKLDIDDIARRRIDCPAVRKRRSNVIDTQGHAQLIGSK